MNLSNPSEATIADGQGEGTIQDDDAFVPGVELQYMSATGGFFVTPGGTLSVALSTIDSPNDLSGFQLAFDNSDVADDELQLKNWVANAAAWANSADGTLNTPALDRFVAGEVSDLVGNTNLQEVETFTFDNQYLVVTSLVINGELADPADLPAGPQPTNWLAQRSEILSLVVTFNDVPTIAAADVELVNLGVDAPAEADVPFAVTPAHLVQAFNVVTLSFAAGELTQGVYEFRILPTATDSFGHPIDGNNDGTVNDAYVLSGSAANGLFQLTGDWNGDGSVSMFDWSTFSYWFGQAVPPAPQYADLNGDSGVTILDLPLFQANFGTSLIFTGAAAFPAAADVGPPWDATAQAVEAVVRIEDDAADHLPSVLKALDWVDPLDFVDSQPGRKAPTKHATGDVAVDLLMAAWAADA